MKRLSPTETEIQSFHSATRRGEEIEAHGMSVSLPPESPEAALDRFSRYERNDLVAAHQAEVRALRAHAVDLETVIDKMKRQATHLVLLLLAAGLLAAYFVVRDLSCPAVPWRL